MDDCQDHLHLPQHHRSPFPPSTAWGLLASPVLLPMTTQAYSFVPLTNMVINASSKNRRKNWKGDAVFGMLTHGPCCWLNVGAIGGNVHGVSTSVQSLSSAPPFLTVLLCLLFLLNITSSSTSSTTSLSSSTYSTMSLSLSSFTSPSTSSIPSTSC